MGFASPSHWLIVLVLALIIFGPNKLPEIGRSLEKSRHRTCFAVTRNHHRAWPEFCERSMKHGVFTSQPPPHIDKTQE